MYPQGGTASTLSGSSATYGEPLGVLALKFMQLICEGHNQEFQVLLTESAEYSRAVATNMTKLSKVHAMSLPSSGCFGVTRSGDLCKLLFDLYPQQAGSG